MRAQERRGCVLAQTVRIATLAVDGVAAVRLSSTMSSIRIHRITKVEYDIILPQIDDWWGGPARHLFHPIFVYHFSDTSLIALEGNTAVGVLFGFMSQTEPGLAYIHAVVTDPSKRCVSLGRRLYESFFDVVRGRGCFKAQAIVLPNNAVSLGFHKALGFEAIEGSVYKDNILVVENYAGPGIDRVVSTRLI